MHFSRHSLAYPRNLIGQECLQLELRLKAEFSLFFGDWWSHIVSLLNELLLTVPESKRANGAAFPMHASVFTRKK